MEESKTSKGKEILTILLFTMVIATGTLAWIVWSSNDNTKMNVTIGELADVSFKTGSDINIGNLSPSFYYDDGALTEFSIRKKKGLTTDLNTSIYLDITSIDDELKNDSFKYVLLSSSDGNTYNEVTNGSFKDASVGKLSIVTDSPLAENKTYYKFYIWIDGNNENNETMQGRSMKASLNVEVATPAVNAVTLIEGLDDGTTGDNGSGVYKISHEAIASDSSATGKEIPAITDYRYYGASPNNYICLDMEGGSTCPDKHLYRIIGSIYEENTSQNLVKVMKATPLTDGTTSEFSWDCKGSGSNTKLLVGDVAVCGGNCGSSSNIWSNEDEDSSLMQLLNGIWLKNEDGNIFNNSTTSTNINFQNNKLSKNFINHINEISRFYLGGDTYYSKTNLMYLSERGTNSYGNSSYWDGTIGLLSPSDYGYASGQECSQSTYLSEYGSGCYNKNWIYSGGEILVITPYTILDEVLLINDKNVSYTCANAVGEVYPTFYLDKDVSIVSGDGSLNNPYLLK